MDSSPNTPASASEPGPIEVSVHASPRFWPFICTGAVIGLLLAIISAYTGDESAEFTRAAIASFLGAGFAAAGAFLAGVAYLIVDRITRSRSRRATALPMDDSEA